MNDPDPIPEFGPYRIETHFASVGPVHYFQAWRHTGADIEYLCQIRRLDLRFVEDKSAQRRMLEEARLVIGLDHPGIIAVQDYGVADGELYVEEEHVDGASLQNVVQWLGTLDAGVALLIAYRLAEVLAYVHTLEDGLGRPLGMVHRNLTPQHVHITPHGEAKLSGFGLARFRGQVLHTATGFTRFQLAYCSPEEVLGNPVDHRCDLFGLGVLLYEMLCGSAPFSPSSLEEARSVAVTGEYTALAEHNAELGPSISQFVDDLLQREPRDRPESARVVCERCWELWRELGTSGDESRLRLAVANVAPPAGDLSLDCE